MFLWVDDLRRPPSDKYVWAKSVHEAIIHICQMTCPDGTHNRMEQKGIDDIPIHLHTMNPVGRENMRRIIQHNGWKQIY